jgi:hypothetical protein
VGSDGSQPPPFVKVMVYFVSDTAKVVTAIILHMVILWWLECVTKWLPWGVVLHLNLLCNDIVISIAEGCRTADT